MARRSSCKKLHVTYLYPPPVNHPGLMVCIKIHQSRLGDFWISNCILDEDFRRPILIPVDCHSGLKTGWYMKTTSLEWIVKKEKKTSDLIPQLMSWKCQNSLIIHISLGVGSKVSGKSAIFSPLKIALPPPPLFLSLVPIFPKHQMRMIRLGMICWGRGRNSVRPPLLQMLFEMVRHYNCLVLK